MKIILKSMNYDVVEEMKKVLGSRCFKSDRSSYIDCDELRDVTLGDGVILKTHEDQITLDLAGKLFTVEDNEFESVVIR